MRGFEYLLANGRRLRIGRRRGQGKIGKGVSAPHPRRYHDGTDSVAFIRKKTSS